MSGLAEIECVYPNTLNEVLELLADPATRGMLLAGGSDAMVQLEAGARPMPERMISLLGVPELKTISRDGDTVYLGAAATYTDLRRDLMVCDALPALVDAASEVGGFQIQSMGTLGGSMANASPAGDPAPPLLVTDGEVVVASVDGERRIPLYSFWTGYKAIDLKENELILRLELPALPKGWQEGWRKLGQRKAQAISKVMGAWRGYEVDGRVEEFRVAMGSVGPTSHRLLEVEKAVRGQVLNDSLIAEAERIASDSVQPIDDIRSTASYRKWVSGRLVRSFLENLAG